MFAMAFKVDLGSLSIPPGDYAPEVSTPKGESTSGGVILQRIRLVPRKEGFEPLVIGDVKYKDSKAELRTFEHVDLLYRRRLQQPFPVDVKVYTALLDKLRAFFDASNFTTTLAGPPANLK
jgi:hypothetical protein